MKKIVVCIIVIAIMVSCTACSNNDESVTMAESLIASIGDATIENENAIIFAENFYNNLSDSQKAKVSNYEVLLEARNSIDQAKADEERRIAEEKAAEEERIKKEKAAEEERKKEEEAKRKEAEETAKKEKREYVIEQLKRIIEDSRSSSKSSDTVFYEEYNVSYDEDLMCFSISFTNKWMSDIILKDKNKTGWGFATMVIEKQSSDILNLLKQWGADNDGLLIVFNNYYNTDNYLFAIYNGKVIYDVANDT